jgi:hypothetical protein
MNRVNIEMRHVFSKVKIRALSTELSGTPAISNVSATLVGYKAVIQDGAIGKGVAEDQVFVAFPASPTTDALSAPRVVYAGGEDITTIKINSATIGTTTHTGSVARFNKKLLPGRSYTLTVKFDELVWAASNVYWETVASGDKAPGYLTFDKVITETPYNQGYQGVFFKWGSLVGISPAQGSGSNDTEKNAYSTSTPVYIPNYNAGSPLASTWSKPTTSSYGSWSSTNDQSTALATDIPYMDANYTSSDYSRNSTFVIDAERNRPEDYAKKVGDICQYIGKTGAGPTDYRLPTSSEMGTTLTDSPGFTPSTPVSGGWVRGPGNFTYTMSAGTPDGKTDLIKTKGLGSAVNSAMGVVLPGSGYRTSNGVLNRVGGGGDYWNGSAGSATTGGRFIFLYDGINPDGPAARSYGFSVRCVRN